MLALGVDIGGTKIGAGVVDDEGRILAQTRVPTDAVEVANIDRAVARAYHELAEAYPIERVGVAAAGFVSSDRRTMSFAPNIAWRDYPLAERIEALIGGVSVVVENDANAAGWAEFRFGAARHAEHMLMITLGTGLGGAVVTDGRLLRGWAGVAAEIGHMRVVPHGHVCGCGREGCWEQYAAGSALVREARAAAIRRPDEAVALVERSGGSIDAITGPVVTLAAQEGDPFAVELLADLGRWVGEGAAAVAALLDPQIVVIGGGVSAAGDLVLAPARRAFLEQLSGRGHRPEAELAIAEMGNEAGIVGAADLARI